MDLDSLKKSVANLTLYDLKAGVRQVQNAVMNYTEMEAKVREATNNDPWYVLAQIDRRQMWNTSLHAAPVPIAIPEE
jgi:hypothetical protein